MMSGGWDVMGDSAILVMDGSVSDRCEALRIMTKQR